MLKIPDERAPVFSFVVALLFTIHTMHVESVDWATERKDVMYSLFFLLSWLGYFNFLDKKNLFNSLLINLLQRVLCYVLKATTTFATH
ncbi:MAG: hypothetical protein J7L95_03230 [Prolixibacteraceae bacterium]|nr:hypothetical protein [Prolixibacteraceae bacterium]